MKVPSQNITAVAVLFVDVGWEMKSRNVIVYFQRISTAGLIVRSAVSIVGDDLG